MKSSDLEFGRRAFLAGATAFGAASWAGCRGVGAGAKPLKFLFMTDHHVESDFVQGFGLSKGEPVYTMWKPGDHAALAETYRFINTDPYCRDIDCALFGGDQINTGYDSTPADKAAEMANYRRLLDCLDVHAKTRGRTADMDFVAAPWTCTQNLGGKGKKTAYSVEPKPLASRVVALQGNHDTGVTDFYRDCAFTAGDVRFIGFFASYVGLPPPPGQRFHSTAKIADGTIAFIEAEMKKAAANPRIRHIVLCSHWAIAPAGRNFVCPILDACKENGMSDNRKRLLALAEKYGCDLYINGHEHNGQYPVARMGALSDINCGTLTAGPGKSSGAFAIVEIHPDRALFTVYSRAVAEERNGSCVITARPQRLFVREIPLRPIR